MERVRKSFAAHKTLPIDYRIGQLKNLKKLLEENKEKILDAVYKDLHKVLYGVTLCTQNVGVCERTLKWCRYVA